MTKEQLGWSYNPASLILVGEITETLRAQGNISAAGTRIDATADSPVKDGVYYEIPQAQVGLMQYSEFANSARKFNEIPSTETAYSGRHPWNLIGATSLDAVFYPYTTQTDEYRAGKWLPYWTKPTASGSGPTSEDLNPYNPFNVLSGINPPWMSSGHNIAMALNYNPKDSGVDGRGGFVGETGTYPDGAGAPIDFYFEKDHWARHTVETQGIRSVGFKAPMVLTGWGYDTEGIPVPSGSGNTFHPEAMYNPHLWKSGPVDLRWHEGRGVWTAVGGGAEIIKFTIDNVGPAIGQNATACDEVRVTVNEIGCDTTSASVGDTGVRVYDDDLCFFNLPISLLIGMKGTAQKFINPYTDPEEDGDCYAQGYAEGACRWVVTGLCCGEEIE